MRKKAIYICIALLFGLIMAGCGADRQPARVWQTRDTVEAYAVDGFSVLGKAPAPAVSTIGEGEYPYPGRPVTGARAAAVRAESDRMFASLGDDIQAGTVKKHAAADLQYGFTPTSERIIARIRLAGEVTGAHPTGLFLPAGEIVTVTVSPETAALGLRLAVNYGMPDLGGTSFARMPRLAVTFPLDQTTVRIASPLGGTLDLIGNGVWADVELSGAIRSPLYRYGADEAPSQGQGPAHLVLSNLFVTAPANVFEAETIDAVCAYWRSAVETLGLSRLNEPLRIVFDDGAPDRSRLRLPVSDAAVFFDPKRLYDGEGQAIVEGLAAQASFGFIGKEAGVKALTYRVMSRMSAAALKRSTGEASPFDGYGVLKGIDLSAETFEADVDTRAALLIGLDCTLGADVAALVGAADADSLVLAAAEQTGQNLAAYASLFKLSLTQPTLDRLAEYGKPFYPVANLFVGHAAYPVAQGSTRLDLAAFTADPAGVFRLTKVKGTGLTKVSDGVYDFVPQADETTVTLVYKNTVTRVKTTVTGTLALVSSYRYVPELVDIAALGRLAPVEVDGATLTAPFITPVTHSSLLYRGDFEARTDGAYYGGTAAFGKAGSQVEYAFYGDTVLYYAYPSEGVAHVAIDDKPVGSFDLSSAGTFRPVYYATGLKGKHTLTISCESGEINVAYFAVSYDPNLAPPFPRWLKLTLLFGGVALVIAGILLLLFLLVFPLLNKYRGTDFPCRNFKTENQKKRDKAHRAKMKYDKLQAKTKAEDYDAYDDSWVPTVILPPVTKPADADSTPHFSQRAVRVTLAQSQDRTPPPKPKKEQSGPKTVAIPIGPAPKTTAKAEARPATVSRSVHTETAAAHERPAKTVTKAVPRKPLPTKASSASGATAVKTAAVPAQAGKPGTAGKAAEGAVKTAAAPKATAKSPGPVKTSAKTAMPRAGTNASKGAPAVKAAKGTAKTAPKASATKTAPKSSGGPGKTGTKAGGGRK